MRTRTVISVLAFWVLSVYCTTFISASVYTKPSEDMALYKVTSGLATYYADSSGSWTPFTHYHTIISGGHYARDYLGRWVFRDKDLRLSGAVTIENDIGR